jgi:TonB-linked SusC/RagA family outer membrane protein
MLCSLLALPAIAQQVRTVSGTVKEANGDPLAGVSVFLKGSTAAAVTDINGAYIIGVPSAGATLVFSFLGFASQEIAVGSQKVIDVTLLEHIQRIDEVVVVGYGTQKKESVVAALSTVSSEALLKMPASNLGMALAGRLPGLTVIQSSGVPGGETMAYFIRGRGTLNGTAPLTLVDGVERALGMSLDPHEVETISVLKDASATAVYGVRGANGVILVTTRRGQSGQPKIDVTMEQSWQAPTRTPPSLSAYDYAVLRNQLEVQNGRNPMYSDYALERYRLADQTDLYPVRDMAGDFMHDAAPMQRINVNVSGGTEKMRYFTSVAYLHQQGIFKTEKSKEFDYDPSSRAHRVNFRSNIDVNLTPILSMFLNISGEMLKRNDPMSISANEGEAYNYIMNAIYLTPNNAQNDLTPDGEVLVNPNLAQGAGSVYALLNRTGFRMMTNNNVAAMLGVELKLDFITKGLSIKATPSYDVWSSHAQHRSRSYATFEAIEDPANPGTVLYRPYGSGINTNLSNDQAHSTLTVFNIDASINYARTFGDHAVSALALFNRYQRISGNDLPYNYIGWVGRATYAYRNRYLAEFNCGYNGSEQFAPGHKMGFFPSVSAGWVLSEEDFIRQAAPWLTFAKIRASYGQVGSDQAGGRRFAFLTLWNGSYESQIGNEELEWEVANKYNIGLDLRLFNDFTLEADVFYEYRNNILIGSDGLIPTGVFGNGSVNDGGILPRINFGEMENRGFEIVGGYQKSFTKDLRLELQGSVAFARNKVLNANEVLLPEEYAYRLRSTGYRYGQLFMQEAAGYFNSEQEILDWYDQSALGGTPHVGDLKYVDHNGDGIINELDVAPLGNPDTPEWTFSLGGAISYKGFDLTMLWQGVAGRSLYMNGSTIMMENYTLNQWHQEAWSQERYDAGLPITYPRLDPSGTSANHLNSNFWLLNSSYIRLRNLELGYTLPKKWSQKVGATMLRVYVNGMNLLTFDHFPFHYQDPEMAGTGGYNATSVYPIFKTYNVGLNISF